MTSVFRRRAERPTTASSLPDGSRRKLVESEVPTFVAVQRQRPWTASASSPSRKVLPLPGVTSLSFNGKKAALSAADTGLDRVRSLSINPKISVSDREAVSELIAMVEDTRTPKVEQGVFDLVHDLKKEIEVVRLENQRLLEHHRELQVTEFRHVLSAVFIWSPFFAGPIGSIRSSGRDEAA